MGDKKSRGCLDCGVYNCEVLNKSFPANCPTRELDGRELELTLEMYRSGDLDARMARAAAVVEGEYYCRLTRVEETMAFAGRLGAEKIGLASCVGLMAETKILGKIIEKHGFEVNAVCCKIGATDKINIGLADEEKVYPGCPESICNPIMQARHLNSWGSDLNIIMGLCVGHDSLFIRHSQAPVTVLAAKDRVTGHNPLAALYTSNFYYRRLLQPEKGPLGRPVKEAGNKA